MKGNLKTKLKKHRISVTRTRLAMLDIFLRSNEALTHNDFLRSPSLRFDRTTVFRTLNLFVEKRMILRIPATDGVNRYLLQQPATFVHSTFICSRCKKIIPLKNIVPPKVKLPKGFKQQNVDIMVRGLCDSCKSMQ
jgi:Fur family ferric uptake transcriptional regulator